MATDEDLRAKTRRVLLRPDIDPRALANLFHDTYERLAPNYGYETRPETRKFNPRSDNGRLMIATCASILEQLRKTRAELQTAHGTPAEFEAAVWAAHAQLFVTTEEAEAAIAKYRDEWNLAPEVEIREHRDG
jgi:hypothetical protein